jgi:hypothetical protein
MTCSDVADRHLHDPADVADDRPCFQGAESDDLRDAVTAVLLGNVVDDLSPPPLAEIDVDVRQRHPLRIQEAFEVEVEVERIDVRDLEGVRDEAAG